MHLLRFRLLIALCLITLPVCAQEFVVKTITFTGYAAASDVDLLTATGLRQSASVSGADLQAAAQKLNATGLFNHVGYKFDGQGLSFRLEPATDLVPASFDNFVWLDANSLDKQVRAKVPLYKGRLIAGSGLEQSVIDALTAIAGEQHLTATVVALPSVNLKTGVTTGDQFRLSSPAVTVSRLTIDGASAAETDKLGPVIKAAVGEDYSFSVTPVELTTAITKIYHDQGFLDVRVTDMGHDAPILTADRVSVPVRLAVVEGSQYHLGKLTLAGSVLMTQDEFSKSATMRLGDIASEEQLRRTLLLVSGPYHSKGYLRARINAVPALNQTTHVADYTIDVAPGEQYLMGKLELANLLEAQRARFLAVWMMKAGNPYDTSYPPSFLVKNAASLHDLDGYSASYKQYEHEDTHIVDLTVTFLKDGRLR